MALIQTQEELRQIYAQPKERSVKKQIDHLDHYCRRFIELSPFCVLSTQSADGRADVSPRGDAAGFVQVMDDHTLLIPDWPGNNRLDSFNNILSNPSVGLLFLVPGVDETLRVNGKAEPRNDEDLLGLWQREQHRPITVLLVRVEEAFLHCAKALMRSKLWDARRHIQRSQLPSMGEMLKTQIGWATAETQEEMLERYKKTMY